MRFDVLIRLDAGGSTGLGHLRRCFALACAFRKLGISAAFLARDPGFVQTWTRNKFPVFAVRSKNIAGEVREISRFLSKHPVRLFILDHYDYSPRDAAAIKKKTCAVAYVDDTARWKAFPVDAVINHNIDAYKLPYPRKGPKLYLGTRYSLMSEEAVRLRHRKKNPGFNFFITLGGGADPAHIQKLMTAFNLIRDKAPEAKAFVAPGIGWKAVKPGVNIRWVAPQKFLTAMSRCHAAISSSGVTSYELACLGIPAVLLTVADNQAGICREMARKKCALDGGWIQKTSAEKIARMAVNLYRNRSLYRRIQTNQKKLVGTRGPLRLARELQKEFLK